MKRKPSGSFFVSIALHVILGAALIQVLLQPLPLGKLFNFPQAARPSVEHLHFVETPQAGPVTREGRSGGNGRPVTKETPPPVTAPTSVPSALPPAPPAKTPPPAAPSAGTGPVVGVGGVTQGIRPEYADPKVWVPPSGAVAEAPKTPKERADSVIAQHIQAHNDSMLASAGIRKPGDWTVTHNGKKYGIDQQYIHLGPISIPNAILALLPINKVQGNPTSDEAQYNARHDEISEQAQRGIDEASFNDAVRKERQRNEAEHKHEEEERNTHPSSPSDQTQQPPQTIAKDGGGQ